MQKYLKFIILFVLALLILWYFGKDLNWQEVRGALAKADKLYLSLAVLIICLGYFIRAVRWKALLKPITPVSMKELFATTTVGFAAIFLIGRAGEIVRPMWLPMRDKRVRPSAALVTLGLERIFDFAALVTFFSLNLLWFSPPPERSSEFASIKLLGYILLGCVVAGFIVMYVYQQRSAGINKWFARVTDKKIIPARLRRIFLSILNQLAAALAVLRSWREGFYVFFWTIVLWLAIAFPTWFVMIAFGLPLTFSDSLFIMGFAVVSSVVPTPGGAAGAFHTATAGSLIFLLPSIRYEDAAAFSIATHLVYFAPALIFGLYYFAKGDISVERFRNLISSEHAAEEIESKAPNSGAAA